MICSAQGSRRGSGSLGGFAEMLSSAPGRSIEMNDANFYVNFLRRSTAMLAWKNHYYVLSYTFAYYVILKLCRLLRMNYEWVTLTDSVLKSFAERVCEKHDDYVDRDSCLLASAEYFCKGKPRWFYVCSKVSLKKYKVLIVPASDVTAGTILVSETMRNNIQNALHCAHIDNTCFLLPIGEDSLSFADEVKVSLISNPHESTNNLTDSLLENYFSVPHFLRTDDIFGIDTKECIPDQLYSLNSPTLSVIYFRVNSMKVDNSLTNTGSYVVRGRSTLIQEPNVNSYLPHKCLCSNTSGSPNQLYNETKETLAHRYPPSLSEALENLEQCILPFLRHEIQLRVKPMFLVKGPQSSARRKLVQIAAERLGLHLLSVDVAEVQALTSAQTEAKLRIVLHNAGQSVPCILCLNNIEVFGKNSEGQKDERIISAFSTEINAMYEKRAKYPLIIVATSDETDIPAEIQRMFIETISMDQLDQCKRTNLISWLIEERGLNCQADFSKIAGMCSDFRISDFSALVSHATKIRCKRATEGSESLTVTQEDFDKAYEYMQSIYSDSKGAPRVPRVNWEDIGGLAELKHEIMRRIQLPLLNAFGFGQSGLLLYGPPGTGKTLLAKAVATEYQLHFLSIKGPEVLNMYVGQSEKNVRQVFERARAAAPCIIFFDELDSLAPNRGRSGDSGGVMDRVVSQLLAEMDGLESSSSIFIIGATNRPDLIDPALLRPGRFDKLLYVGIHSDRSSQLSVLKALTRKFTLLEKGEELERLVEQLPNHLTGADLYAVCSDAWLGAARKILSERNDHQNATADEATKENDIDNDITVELQDFVDAARKMVPSVSEEEAERYRKMHMELSSVS